jgi:hypothetical protein
VNSVFLRDIVIAKSKQSVCSDSESTERKVGSNQCVEMQSQRAVPLFVVINLNVVAIIMAVI